MKDSSTAGIEIGREPRPLRPTTEGPTLVDQPRPDALAAGFEAAVILIAHPEDRRLGARFRLAPGATLEFGRSSTAEVSLPEVPSLSRSHARISFREGRVVLEDLGSRNGTFLNDRRVRGMVEIRSGDRFQVGAVHFKFLHEQDVEHAYHEAIYELVARDGLTGIFNRRKFLEEAARELSRAQRHGRHLALVMIDIDHFKKVNDEHGHLGGDSVLKQLAARFQALIRAEEIFARVGGEEFAVLSPENDLEGACALAEKLRALCTGEPFDCGGTPVKVTASFGVAHLKPEMCRFEDLYQAADLALYRAKGQGRNRVHVAG
jgi:two-component system, cell cycle response regulator